MHGIDLNRLDLNLLKVFIAIFEEGSVTGAGAKLGLAQSSMSHALTRLRTSLHDTLFVRCTNGVIPTAYAESIAKPVRQLLDGLEAALDRGRDFDPRVSDRSFTLVMSDLAEAEILPPLIAHLRARAPNMSISVTQIRASMYHEALEAGEADLVIGLLPPRHADLFQQRLFDAEFTCFMRNGHPLQHNLTLETFLRASHLVVGPPLTSESHVQRALGSQESKRRIVLRVPHYNAAPRVLVETDLIAVLPMIVESHSLIRGNLTHAPCPFPIGPLVLHQIWHARSQHDNGSRWLRQQLAMLVRSSGTDLQDARHVIA